MSSLANNHLNATPFAIEHPSTLVPQPATIEHLNVTSLSDDHLNVSTAERPTTPTLVPQPTIIDIDHLNATPLTLTLELPNVPVPTNNFQKLLIRGVYPLDAVPVGPDSFFLQNFISEDMELAMERALFASNAWTDPSNPDFMYRGKQLRRQKLFLSRSYDVNPDVNAPPSILHKYGYPGFQYGSMKSYRPFEAIPEVCAFANMLERDMLFNGEPVLINHIIGTKYRDSEDNIGFHSDKVTDIAPGSPIISLSLGETREFHLGLPDPEDPKSTLLTDVFVLHSGDLFVLGPLTNMQYRHAVVPVADEVEIQRDPNVAIQPRISIVMRNIATTITSEEAEAHGAKTVEKRVKNQAKKAEARAAKTVEDRVENQAEKAGARAAKVAKAAKRRVKKLKAQAAVRPRDPDEEEDDYDCQPAAAKKSAVRSRDLDEEDDYGHQPASAKKSKTE